MQDYRDFPLLDARRRAHLSQDALALHVGIDRSVISRAERGLARLSPDVHARIVAHCVEAARRS